MSESSKNQVPTATQFFGVSDSSQITWAHAVNSRDRLMHAVAPTSTAMILEADVILGNLGKDSVPIMAHPPATESDLTLEDFLTSAFISRKGVKLDFKLMDAVEPALQTLKSIARNFDPIPIFLNANILTPQCCNRLYVDGVQFIQLCTRYFPGATLSLGWISPDHQECGPEGHYTWKTTHEMADLCAPLIQDVTFPVCIRFVRKSLPQIKWLLSQSSRYSLTFWTHFQDVIPMEDLIFICENVDKHKVYYDLEHLEERLNKELPGNLKFRPDGWKGLN